MRYEEFRTWLFAFIKPAPVNDAASRCRRVEKCYGIDLDEEYAKDGGRGLLSLLDAPGALDALGLTGTKTAKAGLSSIKSAVNRYFEFCEESHSH